MSQHKQFDRGREPKEPEIINKIINNKYELLNKQDPKKFVDLAHEFGKTLVGEHVTTSQIRKFYYDVKRLSYTIEKAKVDLQMIRPRLAYAKGKKPELASFQKIMENLINSISTDKELEGFKDFFEAIIAYHKAEGGKD